jgi:hypothetical protein
MLRTYTINGHVIDLKKVGIIGPRNGYGNFTIWLTGGIKPLEAYSKTGTEREDLISVWQIYLHGEK